MNDYFNDCSEDLSLDLEAKNVEFGYFNYVEPEVKVIADPEQIKRVVHNIVNNSVKYMDKDKPKINLRVKDVGILFRSKLKITEKELRQKICQMCSRDFTGRTHQEIPQKEEAVLVFLL